MHLARFRVTSIRLIEDGQNVTRVDSEICQYYLSYVHVFVPPRMISINDMKDEIRLADLFERAAKRIH